MTVILNDHNYLWVSESYTLPRFRLIPSDKDVRKNQVTHIPFRDTLAGNC